MREPSADEPDTEDFGVGVTADLQGGSLPYFQNLLSIFLIVPIILGFVSKVNLSVILRKRFLKMRLHAKCLEKRWRRSSCGIR